MPRSLIVNNGADLEAGFSTIGAGLVSLTYKGIPMILQPKDINLYNSSDHYYGKTLGRIAGRIPSHFQVGHNEFDVVSNDPGGINCHGSGMESLSFKKWNVYIANQPQGNYIIFTYYSRDGEAGFPGNVFFKVTYFLPYGKNEIHVYQKAKSDQDTPILMSFHPYFNLGREENVDNYTLKVKASRYGAFKEGTELIESIEKVPAYLDFRRESRLKTKLDGIKKNSKFPDTFDHFLLFDEKNTEQPQITLSNGKTKLEVLTDYEGANFYVDTSMSKDEFVNRDNLLYRRAIAIEPQNSRIPFSSIILKAGQKYSHFMVFRFTDAKE